MEVRIKMTTHKLDRNFAYWQEENLKIIAACVVSIVNKIKIVKKNVANNIQQMNDIGHHTYKHTCLPTWH